MFEADPQLDALLDRHQTFEVAISAEGPLPLGRPVYDDLRSIAHTGFTLTPRQLLHAIGSKTAALPASRVDECLSAAQLYVRVLDLQADHLSYVGDYGSDLQANRSQEVGIGIMCLIAQRYFSIPWDQLGPIPGNASRFDYRGVGSGLECIFEAKGTSDKGRQRAQIQDALVKKAAHHERGDTFDVELAISTYIGRDGDLPRIVLADPDKASIRHLFDQGDSRYYRLRHYSRVLQFIGLPASAYELNRYARGYLKGKKQLSKLISLEKAQSGFLSTLRVQGDQFVGRWFDGSRLLSKRSRSRSRVPSAPLARALRVFQGVRRDVYHAGLDAEPFGHALLLPTEADSYRTYGDSRVSVFADGTILLFQRQSR